MKKGWSLVLFILLFPFVLRGHGDLHDRIEAATKKIAKDSGNVDLYMERGELHRAHRSFDAAQADFDRALALKPDIDLAYFGKARLFLDAGWPLSGLISVDKFLKKHPQHTEGQIVKARLLVRVERFVEAADLYGKAVQLPNGKKPEYYFERSQAYASAGEEHLGKAVAALDDGIQALGPLVTLVLPAIDLELKGKKYDAALRRLDPLIATAPRKEHYLAQKGDILLQAGRKEEARAAYTAALKELNSLPPARRKVRVVVDLESRVNKQLAEIDQP